MSEITNFFSGSGTDNKGRRLSDILDWQDADLERVHDYIQWMFPTRKSSSFNPSAPLLTDQDVEEFESNQLLRLAAITSTFRFRLFLDLGAERPHWVEPNNHNQLRITRVIESIGETISPEMARNFYDSVNEVYERNWNDIIISPRTNEFWRMAIPKSHRP